MKWTNGLASSRLVAHGMQQWRGAECNNRCPQEKKEQLSPNERGCVLIEKRQPLPKDLQN
jgi:hypothetical protein